MKKVMHVFLGLLVAAGILACVSESLTARWQTSPDRSAVTPATITVFRSWSIWKNAVSANKKSEDFESDAANGGGLSYPYLTGKGFLLNGNGSAQIFNESRWDSGNFLHFRAWKEGLTFTFPNSEPVNAFGFDYTSNEPWQLSIEGSKIALSKDSKSFVGVIINGATINKFVLSGWENAQGGLSVDNIAYVTR